MMLQLALWVTLVASPPNTVVSLSPEAPVKGKDEFAWLTVRTAADQDVPRVKASAGEVGPLERVGPGEFRARFSLPKTRYPEVVALIAWNPHLGPDQDQSVGCLRVPLASSITFPGRSEPLAQTTLEIAGQTFGPVQADAQGRFEMPVVVPPGVRTAKGLAVDKVGNRRSSRFDLHVPPPEPLACIVSPAKLWADGKSATQIICAGSEPNGRPLQRGIPQLRAKLGNVEGPRTLQEGLWEWRYRAPKLAGEERVETRVGSGAAQAWELALVPGPAAKLELASEEPLIHQGGSGQLEVKVLDAAGKPRPGATLQARATSGEAKTQEISPGVHRVELSLPLSAPEEVELALTAQGPVLPELPAPPEVKYQVRVQVGPPIPVNVRLQVAGAEILFWAEDPQGRVLPKRPLRLYVDGAQVRFEDLGDGRHRARVAQPFRSVSAADSETGITAVARGNR